MESARDRFESAPRTAKRKIIVWKPDLPHIKDYFLSDTLPQGTNAVPVEEPPSPSSPAASPPPNKNGSKKNRLRVAVLHNLKKHAPADGLHPPDAFAELDSEANIAAYAAALRAGGHHVTGIDGNPDLFRRLKRLKVDICFNTCEGYRGDAREAQVPALLEMMGIPYTGGKVTCLANTLDKAATKRILMTYGLPTARFQEFTHVDLPLDPGLHFPLFVKPNREGTGIGIDSKSLVRTGEQLRAKLSYILNEYCESALVEEYIPGRDITCGLVGNLSALEAGQPIPDLRRELPGPGGGVDWSGIHFFPISEVDYSRIPDMDPYYSYAVKALSLEEYPYFCPAPIPEDVAAEVRRLTLETFRVTQSLDFARVDFRLHSGENFRPYIIEINSLPGLTPYSDQTIFALSEGWSYARLIQSVLEAGARRFGLIGDLENGEALRNEKISADRP
jgi:D-alanine-D-alanine ligase